MNIEFIDLGLSSTTLQAIETLGYITPTPIQAKAIPILMAGRNVVGQAQTGTGKTAAFVIPILEKLRTGNGKIQTLILTPTRELAIQVTDAAKSFAQFSGLKITSVYGGQSYEVQIRAIQKGTDIVVGTPGRIMDLMRKNVLDFGHVNFVVLDEADEMLDMGFAEDVEIILQSIPEERQIALFSATFPKSVKQLAEKYVSDPEQIRIDPTRMTVAETEQRYCFLKESNKLPALCRLLEMETIQSVLIFTRTKLRAQEISDELNLIGFQTESLHGDLNQARRESVLRRLRAHAITILVATDVAARGLDIQELSHVINFDVPQDADDYVHRIGRTGRAGNKGIAITFITPKDKQRLFQIEAYTKQKVTEVKVPSIEEIQAHRDDKFLEELKDQISKGNLSRERKIITRLAETTIDLMEITAAAIHLARANEAKLPTENIIEPSTSFKVIRNAESNLPGKEKRKYKSDSFSGKEGKSHSATKPNTKFNRTKSNDSVEAGMVRLKMNLGNHQGIRPGDIVGAIAGEVGIPGRSIGEISIQDDHTYVDIEEKHIHKVLKHSSGNYSLRGKKVVLTLVNK